MKQQLSFLDTDQGLHVRRIRYEDTIPFLLEIHYARRMPCITDAFGLFLDNEMIGVVTYGIPASKPLCIGIAGVQNEKHVKELNRLVIKPQFNERERERERDEITRPISFLTHSRCWTMGHLWSVMLIQLGRMLVTFIRRAIFSILGLVQNAMIHISRMDYIRELMTKMITAN